MTSSLFNIPACAPMVDDDLPVGGLGCGHFLHSSGGDFRRWRLSPNQPEYDAAVEHDQFYVRWSGGGKSQTIPLCSATGGLAVTSRRLFPFTWREFELANSPLQLESLNFSPIIPGEPRESSLPVYLVVWRVRNNGLRPVEVSFMLTWAAGWPEIVQSATFDMQHDNLCITGSIGDPNSPNRMGVAVPDLHAEGVYKQGMEPWDFSRGSDDIIMDFAGDGELDPAVAASPPQGAAAWVKFDLEPDEVKEIPFVIVWHFPFYESGPAQGKPRHYTQYLGKVRPDNAVVWLAEEVVQNYGTESANYRHWINQISDWHEAVLSDPRWTPAEHAERINRLEALVHADSVWPVDGKLALLPTAAWPANRIHEALSDAPDFASLWPGVSMKLAQD